MWGLSVLPPPPPGEEVGVEEEAPAGGGNEKQEGGKEGFGWCHILTGLTGDPVNWVSRALSLHVGHSKVFRPTGPMGLEATPASYLDLDEHEWRKNKECGSVFSQTSKSWTCTFYFMLSLKMEHGGKSISLILRGHWTSPPVVRPAIAASRGILCTGLAFGQAAWFCKMAGCCCLW